MNKKNNKFLNISQYIKVNIQVKFIAEISSFKLIRQNKNQTKRNVPAAFLLVLF